MSQFTETGLSSPPVPIACRCEPSTRPAEAPTGTSNQPLSPPAGRRARTAARPPLPLLQGRAMGEHFSAVPRHGDWPPTINRGTACCGVWMPSVVPARTPAEAPCPTHQPSTNDQKQSTPRHPQTKAKQQRHQRQPVVTQSTRVACTPVKGCLMCMVLATGPQSAWRSGTFPLKPPQPCVHVVAARGLRVPTTGSLPPCQAGHRLVGGCRPAAAAAWHGTGPLIQAARGRSPSCHRNDVAWPAAAGDVAAGAGDACRPLTGRSLPPSPLRRHPAAAASQGRRRRSPSLDVVRLAARHQHRNVVAVEQDLVQLRDPLAV